MTRRRLALAAMFGVAFGFWLAWTRMTDADQIHISRAGVPTGLVSIPLRYMHSPCELGSLDDVEATIALIASFARRLRREQSFVR